MKYYVQWVTPDGENKRHPCLNLNAALSLSSKLDEMGYWNSGVLPKR